MMNETRNDLMGWRLVNGDVLETLPTLPAESVDVVLTDPPYCSGGREATKGARKSMTRLDDDEWFDSDNLSVQGFTYLLRQCAMQWRRVLKPGGHALVFIDWRMAPHMAAAIESVDLWHRGVLVWDKVNFTMGTHYRNQHEFVLHFSKDKPRAPVRRDVGNVIQCKKTRNQRHPTEKPVELLRRLLTVVATPGDVVLDSFNGSGTTGVAALAEGCSYIGIERSTTFYTQSAARLAAFYSELS